MSAALTFAIRRAGKQSRTHNTFKLKSMVKGIGGYVTHNALRRADHQTQIGLRRLLGPDDSMMCFIAPWVRTSLIKPWDNHQMNENFERD